MTELYYLVFPERERASLLTELLPVVGTGDKPYNRHTSLRALQSVIGHLLARSLIAKRLHLPLGSISLYRTHYGKPECTAAPCIHFTISHSEHTVLCVLSDKPAGADVEYIRPLPYKAIAQRFFTNHECRILSSVPAERQLAFFYRLWAVKESYTKMLGTALFPTVRSCEVPLNDIQEPYRDAEQRQNGVIPFTRLPSVHSYYVQGYLDGSTVYAVCTQDAGMLSVNRLSFQYWFEELSLQRG